MNCFDCLLIDDATTPAVGICSACGGALCADHAIIEPVLVQVTSVGNPSQHAGRGRRLHCSQCAEGAGLVRLPAHVSEAVRPGGDGAGVTVR